ncbi:MAG: DegT/DnrJ/EryC1/StrS family aminotransferase [Paludibacteraceae bacterium]|nr:DegT/DnrJ/EryC1/StrS family aminotransferase [Paludibacteraceae bacterium]
MKRFNIPFSPPDMTEAEVAEVRDAILSGWITTGPRTKQLERQIADYTGVERAVCLNSQTACAEMALRLLGIGPGDEVIVPAYTYTASASVVWHVGATIVFVDVQPTRPEIDYQAVAEAITPRTKAIIPVDLAGIPCDYGRLFDIVESKRSLFTPNSELQRAIGRVAICADAAHAFGASRQGRMVGSIADFSAFSFHAVKNFTTAEGGALTWRSIPGVDNEALYHQVQLLSLHGQSKDALAKTQLGAWEYDIVGPWYKCNMTDIAAALGLVQMQRYPALLERRRQIIERYDNAFRPLGLMVLEHYTDVYLSSGHLYITRVPDATLDERQQIIVRMAEQGIATNVHYKPLPMMTAYRNLGFDIAHFPNAYAQFVNEITLPLHTRLTDEQVDYIIDRYTDILTHR